MSSRTLTPERAGRRPWRVDLRAVLSILVTLVSVGGMLLYAGSLSATRTFLVATRDLPAGTILQSGDLAITQIRADDQIYAAAIPADALGTIVGRPLAEPLHAQQLLIHAQISDRPRLAPDQLALTIAITSENAAGGRLHAGDQIQVLLTRGKGTPDVTAVVVLERATIYDVGLDERAVPLATSGGHTAGEGPLASLTLIVTAEQARAVAAAKHSGDLDVALLPPASTAPGSRTASPTASPPTRGSGE